MGDVAVRGAELFSVKLPKASQHNFILSDDGFDLFRPCDQILEFASAGPTQVGCRLARRLRRRTKVQYAAVGSDGKIAFDYVIRRLNALSAGSEKPVGRLNLR